MRKVLPVILLFSILTFLGFSLFLPGFAKGIIAKKRQLEATAKAEQNLPGLSTLLESKKEKLDILEKTFPTHEELILVAQSLDNLAARSQVSSSLHFESEQPVQDENGDPVLPITITIEGDYAHCFAFLNGLKNNKYLYALQTIEGTTTTGIKNIHKIVIKGKLYVANKG